MPLADKLRSHPGSRPFIQMSPSHSGHPGSGSITPAANWLDQLADAGAGIKRVEQQAIMAIWDQGSGWYDHVPPHQVDAQMLGIRVPMILISIYAKKETVYHNVADHTSILRFIQWNWRLPALNSRNSQLDDLRGMFTF
jgi:phospholipase C